jgi:ornithine cyclodeaminase/alanine dehydrogenase
MHLPLSHFSFILPHPAYIKPWNVVGDKWVGASAGNPARGLPYIMGQVLINEAETLKPLAIMEGGYLTAMRTAGHAAIGTKFLAKRNSRVLTIIGCGAEGKTHLEAIVKLGLYDLKEVRIFDVKEDAMLDFKKEMELVFNLEIKLTESVQAAARGSDIICMVTTAGKPVLLNEWVEPGTHVAATAVYDAEPQITQKADKWVVGNNERDRLWIDNVEEYQLYGYSLVDVYGDLSEIVCGKKAGREDDNEITIMTHLGMGALDIACAYRAYQVARKDGLGLELDLMGEEPSE